MNRETLRFLGCSSEDVQGWGWRRFIHPDDVARLHGGVRRIASMRGARSRRRHRFRRADGESAGIPLGPGVPRRQAEGAARPDVGRHQSRHQRRKRSEDALREADRRKDEFLATLAHELRNPLAPIRNALAVLRLRATTGADRERVRA